MQFLKKVQRQERIVEEIKLVLKPYYNRKKINKDDYKDILRKCVPKVRSLMSCLSIESVQKFKNLAWYEINAYSNLPNVFCRFATAKMVI